MATILKLTGVQAISGGTLNLNGTNTGMATIELLPGWRPRVATRPRGTLGNKSMPRNVTESPPLRIHGATELECVTMLELLAAAMVQASAWRDGAAVSPVILNYAINNTTLSNPLQTAVLGTPGNAEDILSLPVTFNQNLQVFEVNPLILPLERRGLWLADEESQVSSSAAENPVVNTATFTDGALTTPSPVKLDIEFTSGGGVENADALVFIADDADKLYVSTALLGDATGSTSVITANHADADASANETLMIEPNDTNTVQFLPTGNHAFPTTPGTHIYMFFLVLRNNSDSVYWDISQMAYYRPGSSIARIKSLNNLRIEAGANDPHVVSIGPFFFDHPLGMEATIGRAPRFYVTPSAGSGSGHELEVDTIAIVELGLGVTALSIGDANFSFGDTRTEIDHALLTSLKPIVYTGLIGATTNDHSIRFDGIPYIFNQTDEIAALVLGVQDGNWLLSGDPGSGYQPVDVNINATRRPAYLVPK